MTTQLIQLPADEQARKLARIKNRHTRYEVVLTNGVDTYLVMYTPQHSKRGVMAVARERYHHILHITGSMIPCIADRGDVFHGNEWRVLFSGRTQRECYLSGVYPFAQIPDSVMFAPEVVG